MRGRLTVTLAPTHDRVRILATTLGRDVLKAVLPPMEMAHRRAPATLLEGLSLWHGQPLSVVLSAVEPERGFAMGLLDALGFGASTLHYEVAVATEDRRRRASLRGLGDFADLRRLALLTEASR